MTENSINEIGNAYCQAAYAFFEGHKYEAAIENFIKAYECGVRQDEILENLYSCFIRPNELEFRKNYEESRKGIINILYDELEIDFIPASDSKFYLFHPLSKEFLGSFQLDETLIVTDNVEFESILIADCWDFRQMLPFMKEKTWAIVYILLNNQKTRFASFLKLPHFRELYMKNVIIFENTTLMKRVFEENKNIYLPKKRVAASNEYDLILKQIHNKRISDLSQKGESVFLSILIPSYNRGAKALTAVKEICRSDYDSEIEIIVSDNGSTMGVQEYQEIRDMQDSRVRYHRNEYNMGFFENFMKVLEMAQGKYAIYSSDEDIMLIESLSHYLNVFKKSNNCGIFSTSGIGRNFPVAQEQAIRVLDRKENGYGVNHNYMTGLGYNMMLIRKVGAIEFMREHAENTMAVLYPHCVLNLKLALESNMVLCGKPVLWYEGEPEEVDGIDTKSIKPYMTIDSREKQCVDITKLYVDVGFRGTLLCDFYIKSCWKFFWLLYVAVEHYTSYYKEHNITWEDILKDAAQRCVKNIIYIGDYITDEEQANLKKNIVDMYQEISKKGFI